MAEHTGGAPSLQVADLLDACEQLVRSYNPSKTTVDAHCADFAATKRITDADDKRFLEQVMYGCTRYKKLLKVFISSLYFKHAGETQRADMTMYTIFGYLALLRLTELGFSDFRQLVLSQESFKMSVFLKFTFKEENLKDWLRPEWIKIYEPTFVDEQLIDKTLVFAKRVEELQTQLAGKIDAEVAKKEAAAEAARALAEGRGGAGVHTVPVPFELTQPKPRLVPLPEDVVDTTFKATPVPASMYTDSKHLVDRVEIDKKKDQNRLTTKAQYSDPRVQPFKLKVAERPSNLGRIKAEVEAAREAECDFDGPKANPVPKQRAGSGVVRLNSTAILREDDLYRKKQEKEVALLSAYETELRDSSEFDAWQARMRAVDEENRLKEVERRRAETILADEEARAARQRTQLENRALAISAKQEASANEIKRRQEDEQVAAHNKAVVLDIHSQRDKPAQAAEQMVRANHLKAKEVREEREMLEARAAEERKREEEKRADLIKQIRALELVPRERVKVLDPTFTPGFGLLEEMSLAELRERMSIVEAERLEEEEHKRAKIVAGKQEREDELKSKMSRLTSMRDMAAQQSTTKREAVKRAEREAEAKRQLGLGKAQVEAHAKIEAKRAARRREEAKLAEELKAIRIKNTFLAADKDAVERKRWQSQQAGAEREVLDRQGTSLRDASRKADIMDKETAQRLANLKQERQIHEAFLRDYERRCTESAMDSNAAEDALQASRQMLKTRLGLGLSSLERPPSSGLEDTAGGYTAGGYTAGSSWRGDQTSWRGDQTALGQPTVGGLTAASAAGESLQRTKLLNESR